MSNRDKFEKWIKSETGFNTHRTNYPFTPYEAQQYLCHHTNLAWLAWCKALEADEE